MLSKIFARREDYTPIATRSLTSLCRDGTSEEVLKAINDCERSDEHTLEQACIRAKSVQGDPVELAAWKQVIESLVKNNAPISQAAVYVACDFDQALGKQLLKEKQCLSLPSCTVQ